MRHSKICFLVCAIVVFQSVGCATVFRGKEKLLITSNPIGATVFINDKVEGITPLQTQVSRNPSTYSVTIKKDGYDPVAVTIHRQFSKGWFLTSTLLGYGVGGVVDIATKAVYGFPDINVYMTGKDLDSVIALDSTVAQQLSNFRITLKTGKVYKGKQGRLTSSAVEGVAIVEKGVTMDNQSTVIPIADIAAVSVAVSPTRKDLFKEAKIGAVRGAGLGAGLSVLAVLAAEAQITNDNAQAKNDAKKQHRNYYIKKEVNWSKVRAFSAVLVGGGVVLGSILGAQEAHWKSIPIHTAFMPTLNGGICLIEIPF